jgi:hypothetical protein
VKNIPLAQHLVARRVWRPLARTVFFMQRPLWLAYDWLFTKGNLERACLKAFTPLIRLHSRLAHKAGHQRGVQLYRPSSLAYDLAAIGAALLAPVVRWEQACRQKMNQETDSRIRHDPSRN